METQEFAKSVLGDLLRPTALAAPVALILAVLCYERTFGARRPFGSIRGFSKAHSVEGSATATEIPRSRIQLESFLAEIMVSQVSRMLLAVLKAGARLFYIHDLEGNFLYVNQAGLDFTGYTQEDVAAGITIEHVVAEEDWPRARAEIARKIEAAKEGLAGDHLISVYPLRFYAKGASREKDKPIMIDVASGIICDRSGAPRLILGMADIHREVPGGKKKLQEGLKEVLTELAAVGRG